MIGSLLLVVAIVLVVIQSLILIRISYRLVTVGDALMATVNNNFTREGQSSVSHRVSLLCTDQWVGYKHLGDEYPHAVVDHAAGQYVVGAVHTQTIEGCWSIFKRGIVGSFHKVSCKYMPLYVAEFQFRYNNRMNPDIFGTAMDGVLRSFSVTQNRRDNYPHAERP